MQKKESFSIEPIDLFSVPLMWFVETLKDRDLKIDCFLIKKQENNVEEDIEEMILIFEDTTKNFVGNL